MASQYVSRVIGIIYLALGICAFVPSLNGGPSPNTPADLHVKLHFENLFGDLAMNYLLAGILIGFGVAALATSFQVKSARIYSRILFGAALIGMFVGLSPHPISDVVGLLPLYGWTTALMLATVMFTCYGAFFEGPLPPSTVRANAEQ